MQLCITLSALALACCVLQYHAISYQHRHSAQTAAAEFPRQLASLFSDFINLNSLANRSLKARKSEKGDRVLQQNHYENDFGPFISARDFERLISSSLSHLAPSNHQPIHCYLVFSEQGCLNPKQAHVRFIYLSADFFVFSGIVSRLSQPRPSSFARRNALAPFCSHGHHRDEKRDASRHKHYHYCSFKFRCQCSKH